MKKIVLCLVTLGVLAFAKDEVLMQGCVETTLNTTTSIFSCPTGDFKVTYILNSKSARSSYTEPKIEKIGEFKQKEETPTNYTRAN